MLIRSRSLPGSAQSASRGGPAGGASCVRLRRSADTRIAGSPRPGGSRSPPGSTRSASRGGPASGASCVRLRRSARTRIGGSPRAVTGLPLEGQSPMRASGPGRCRRIGKVGLDTALRAYSTSSGGCGREAAAVGCRTDGRGVGSRTIGEGAPPWKRSRPPCWSSSPEGAYRDPRLPEDPPFPRPAPAPKAPPPLDTALRACSTNRRQCPDWQGPDRRPPASRTGDSRASESP